jgi:2-oxoglutarate dehydrogenase E1 component
MSHGTFATRWNLDAIEAAYQRWQHDPEAVDASWRLFFEGFELGASRVGVAGTDSRAQAGIFRLIYAYRNLGHYLANLDPLSEPRASHPLLDLEQFGLEEADLDQTFDTSMFLGVPPQATLR